MMAKTQCTICADKARKKIDAALVIEGASISGVARQYGVSRDALTRHVKNGHVIAKLAKAQAAHDIVEADNLLQEIQEIQRHQKTIFGEARARTAQTDEGKVPNPDNRLALEALRDQSKIIELKGKVLGSFVKDAKTPEIPHGTALVTALPPEAARKIGDIIAESL
jgi:transposase-like protein